MEPLYFLLSVEKNKFEISISVYYGFIYLLMIDLIYIIDRGLTEKDAVKEPQGS